MSRSVRRRPLATLRRRVFGPEPHSRSASTQGRTETPLVPFIRPEHQTADRHPQLAPWLEPVLIAYVVFVLLTWLGSALFNLLLRLSRFGRLALSRQQIVASNWIGGFLLLALGALGFWLASGNIWAMLAAVYCGLLVIPIAATFQCQAGWPRWCMVAYTVVLALLPLAGVAAWLLSPRFKEAAFLSVQGYVVARSWRRGPAIFSA